MKHIKILSSSPVEGANAPLCKFCSITVFCICQEKVGQIFRYFVKNLSGRFECLLLLHTSGLEKSLGSQALMQVPSTSST